MTVLVGWLVGCLDGWLAGWLVGWLVSVGRLGSYNFLRGKLRFGKLVTFRLSVCFHNDIYDCIFLNFMRTLHM